MVVVVVVLGWVAARHLFQGVTEVIPGTVYRSPQLDGAELESAIARLGIRSVVNLRGTGGGNAWYARERAVCAHAGVSHTTVTCAVDEWPPRRIARRLVGVLDAVDRPVLMHCNRGADRVGWASAVAVLSTSGDLAAARAQLSPRFGHFCLRWHCPQHGFLAAYEDWLTRTSAPSSAEAFRRWIAEAYCPPAWDARLKTRTGIPAAAVPGTRSDITVTVLNAGSRPWPVGPNGVRLGVRVAGPFNEIPADTLAPFLDRGTGVTDLGRGTTAKATIVPGAQAEFSAVVRWPEAPGLYLVQVDMVEEGVHWFSEMGWPGLVGPLDLSAASPPPAPDDRSR